MLPINHSQNNIRFAYSAEYFNYLAGQFQLPVAYIIKMESFKFLFKKLQNVEAHNFSNLLHTPYLKLCTNKGTCNLNHTNIVQQGYQKELVD